MALKMPAVRPHVGPGYKWWALSATSLGTLMAVLNGTTLLIALPTLVRALHLSTLLAVWVMLAYMVTQTVLLLTVGRLSDLVGRKRLYVAGFAIFTLAALAAGFAPNGHLLLVARIVQAVGGAMVMGNAVAIVADAFPANQMGLALGINGIVVALGQVAGPILGGLLVSGAGWRWVFWFNVPVGVVGTFWASRQLAEVYRPAAGQRIDYAGNLAYTVGLLGLLLALTWGGVRSWSSPVVGAGLAAALLAGWAFFAIERRAPSPLVQLSLFRQRPFAMANLANLLIAIGRGAMVLLFIFYFQGARGFTALQAGLAVVPMAVAMGMVGPLSGAAADRLGARGLASAGAALVALGLWGQALTLRLATPYWQIAAWMAVVGIGNGLFNSPNTKAVMAAVGADQRGMAAGTRTMLLNTGNVLSIAFVLAVVASSLPASAMLAIFAGEPAQVSTASLLRFGQALRLAFGLMALVSAGAATASFLRGGRTPAATPAAAPGRRAAAR